MLSLMRLQYRGLSNARVANLTLIKSQAFTLTVCDLFDSYE